MGIVSVWQWGKEGLLGAYDHHLRPACPKCLDLQTSQLKVPVSVQTSPPPPVVAEMALVRSGVVRLAVALLGVPLVRKPSLTGFLMTGGIAVFCGTTSYHAFTGDKQYRQFTPYGGILLIAAWLSMIL